MTDDQLYRILFWRPAVAHGVNPAWSAWAREWLHSLALDDVNHLALYATRILRVQESRFPGALPPTGDPGIPWPELRSIMGWGLDTMWNDSQTRGVLLQDGIRLAAENGWVLEQGRCFGGTMERYGLTVSGRNAAEYEMAPVEPLYLPEADAVAPDPFIGLSLAKEAGKSGKPRGRPMKSDPMEDARLYEMWKQAKGAGVPIKLFCQDNGISQHYLQKASDRHRKKMARRKASKQG